jgi:hypothetical protein
MNTTTNKTMANLTKWMLRNGFVPAAHPNQWDAGSLRVAVGGDLLSVIMFTGVAGRTAVEWSIDLPAPEGVPSVPGPVIVATIKAALATR